MNGALALPLPFFFFSPLSLFSPQARRRPPSSGTPSFSELATLVNPTRLSRRRSGRNDRGCSPFAAIVAQYRAPPCPENSFHGGIWELMVDHARERIARTL